MKFWALILVAALFGFSTVSRAELSWHLKAERELMRSEWLAEREGWSDDLRNVAPGRNDRAEKLVDQLRHESLAAMDAAGLRRASLSIKPWSDSYWPIYRGVIANRYADPNFNAAMDWKENEKYLLENLGLGVVSQMSPAEKYDLLVGDPNFTLTKEMINEGKPYYEKDKNVETWMGICHGWAPASFMLERPAHAVEFLAADGKTKILFYPADIKALATLLWAKGSYPIRYVGGRCNAKVPDRDEDDRLADPDCLDSNPGTWHLAIVNQIGVSKRSFVLDTNYDYEVWNQPVYAYQYSFHHPRSGKMIEKLQDAIFPIDDSDPRRKYRAQNAVSYVRVAMNVEYGLERDPDTSLQDEPSRDVNGNVLYEYELELDANGKIVGGEWLTTSHPDFLWVPGLGAKALSPGDLELNRRGDYSEWNTREVVPASWREIARFNSAYGQPLDRIVEKMIQISRRP